MSQYHLPRPGMQDPIAALNHYTGNYISPLRLAVEDGIQPEWSRSRIIVSQILTGFASGTYTYQHSQAFNPEVARELSEEVTAIVKKGATPEELKSLEERLLSIADEHAIETGQPQRTRAALNIEILNLKAEKELAKK